MDPADLHRNDSVPQLDGTPTLSSKALQTPVSAKKGMTLPRIDTEPIYTQLKAAIGEGWTEYKTAMSAFMLGKLNQAELSQTLTKVLSPAPKESPALVSTISLHNTLLTALYANTFRHPPPEPVANWVLATDASHALPTAKASAAGAGDKAEERLKREVMALSARDRRRIKSTKDDTTLNPHGPLHASLAYATALTVPVTANISAEDLPTTTSSLSKTNFDIEIRRRYAMPLASEALEFPTRADIQARIEPICYEEGVGLTSTVPLNTATLTACADLVEAATETYIKELLGKWFAAARTNREGAPMTARFRKKLRREEELDEKGLVSRTSAGLLPCEADVLARSEPLSMDDVRLSLLLDEGRMPQDAFLGQTIVADVEMDFAVDEAFPNGVPAAVENEAGALVNGDVVGAKANLTNGVKEDLRLDDPMAIDSDDYGWAGATPADRDALFGALDTVLAVGY